MRRILTVLLALVLTFALIPAISAEESQETENLVSNLSGDISGLAVDVSAYEGSSAAMQFVLLSPALKIEVCCPTWSRPGGGYFTMSLFKFDKDYSSTVAGSPVASVRYDEFDDNQWLSLDFTADKPLEAGEYIVILDEPEVGQPSGVWLDKATDKQLYFSDGFYDEAHSLRSRVTFLGNPENTFGTPLKPAEEEHGTDTEHSDEPYMDFTIFFNDPDWDYILSPQMGVSTEFEEDHLLITVGPASDDPQLIVMLNDVGKEEGVLVEKYPVMVMKVRRVAETDPTVGEIFFFTETSPGAKSGNNFRFDYEATLDWQYVTIDLSSNRRCKDYFTGMRFDMFDHAPEGGNLEIEWITFFESKEAAAKFNGDFSPYIKATPVPTAKPTEKPVDPTEVPAETQAQQPENTDGGSVSTKAPDKDNTDNTNNTGKKGSPNIGLLIGICAALIVVIAVIIVLLLKNKKK
ncbi:MAG: hypothetical protein IKH41_04810 [Clostridia bacterium]|nr:hypothetical protein [Clostridia bacterium]